MESFKKMLEETRDADEFVAKACYQILGYLGVQYLSRQAWPEYFSISFGNKSIKSTLADDVKKLFDQYGIKYTEKKTKAGYCKTINILQGTSNIHEIKKLGNKLWSKVKRTTMPLIKEYTELVSQVDKSHLNADEWSFDNSHIADMDYWLERYTNEFTKNNYWHDFQKKINTLKEFIPVQNDIDKVNAKRKENSRKPDKERDDFLDLLLDDEYWRITGEKRKR